MEQDAKENIKMNLKEVVYEDVNWIHLAQNGVQWRTLENTVLKYGVL
jgi:hypothetical protein